jgi:DNA-binding protein HU-beta
MNKTELIETFAARNDVSKNKAREMVDSFLEIFSDTLAYGEKIAIIGFGTFLPVQYSKRKTFNVQTGLPLEIPERRLVKFKMSKRLKAKMNP